MHYGQRDAHSAEHDPLLDLCVAGADREPPFRLHSPAARPVVAHAEAIPARPQAIQSCVTTLGCAGGGRREGRERRTSIQTDWHLWARPPATILDGDVQHCAGVDKDHAEVGDGGAAREIHRRKGQPRVTRRIERQPDDLGTGVGDDDAALVVAYVLPSGVPELSEREPPWIVRLSDHDGRRNRQAGRRRLELHLDAPARRERRASQIERLPGLDRQLQVLALVPIAADLALVYAADADVEAEPSLLIAGRLAKCVARVGRKWTLESDLGTGEWRSIHVHDGSADDGLGRQRDDEELVIRTDAALEGQRTGRNPQIDSPAGQPARFRRSSFIGADRQRRARGGAPREPRSHRPIRTVDLDSEGPTRSQHHRAICDWCDGYRFVARLRDYPHVAQVSRRELGVPGIIGCDDLRGGLGEIDDRRPRE